jgi:hypothetical protein
VSPGGLSNNEKFPATTTNFVANLLSTKCREADTKLYIYLSITLCRTGCGSDIRPVSTKSELMLRIQGFVLEGDELTRD